MIRNSWTHRWITLAFFGASLTPGVSLAVEAKLTDDASTNLSQPNATLNGADLFVGYNAARRTFLKFDLSTLPSGTTGSLVAKANLVLWVDTVGSSGSFDLYRVVGTWSEATITHAAAPALGSVQVSGLSVVAPSTFLAVEVTQLVRDWLNGVLPNNGVALVPAGAGISAAFDSKENTGNSHYPRLEIVLTAPGDIEEVATPAGGGLEGGVPQGIATLSLQPSFRLPQLCGANQIPRWNGTSWVCANETTYTGANFALSTQSCPAGQFVTGISSLGTLQCAPANTGPLDLSVRVFSAVPISVIPGNDVQLPFDSVRWDLGGFYNPATPTFLRPPVAGRYLIFAHVSWQFNTAGSRRLQLRHNGVPIIASVWQTPIQDNITNQSVATVFQLSAGDTIEVEAAQTSGSTLNINSSGNFSPEFGMVRLP